ncbi:uncharacterized protein LOC144554666 isoform X2 [Carex rostrata]
MTHSHAYGEEWYWDDRYRKEQATFDWYQRYEAVAPLLRLLLRPSHRILLVGCGNSPFGEEMVNDDYEQVVNIDISSVVIRAMQSKYSHLPHLQYMKMDVRDMSAFEDNSFDAVIDKGTLDSIMCGNDSQVNATKMLKEVHRVLKERGIYIMITYGDPSYRLGLLTDLNLWNINIHVIGWINAERVILQEIQIFDLYLFIEGRK